MNEVKSRISTDPDGKRVYLMSMHTDDLPIIIDYLDQLAVSNGYTKIFVKVRAMYSPVFYMAGYIMEAFVPGYYNGNDDAFFMAKYFDDERRFPENNVLRLFKDMMLTAKGNKHLLPVDNAFKLKMLKEEDVHSMVDVFKVVFDSYPFPIFEPTFLVSSMQEGTRYYGIFDNNYLVAVSSAECDEKYQSAEMTDFAVLSSYRGKSFALLLLEYMEKDLQKLGYRTLFTIARLHELSMNKTFLNAGYQYSGTLNKNTQIAGRIESMNVWYKHLNVIL
ncbi:MAG: putative beta-lysine N-acetyltransferase [Paludibacter sp.]|nr:putative beta-lysine N-acetyltransferase [Paludibacter sp.]